MWKVDAFSGAAKHLNFSERVSWCLETSSITTPFLGRVSVPISFVSLFIFYILSYLLLKTMGCFSGLLMSSASDQKLFCGVCSAFNCSFDEFVWEKVVSPSYSSAILAPPLNFRTTIWWTYRRENIGWVHMGTFWVSDKNLQSDLKDWKSESFWSRVDWILKISTWLLCVKLIVGGTMKVRGQVT